MKLPPAAVTHITGGLKRYGATPASSGLSWTDHEDLALGLRDSWKRPWRWGVQMLDRMLFALEPALAARLRPHFNLLVLAAAQRQG